jgi:hypothetical protein
VCELMGHQEGRGESVRRIVDVQTQGDMKFTAQTAVLDSIRRIGTDPNLRKLLL